MATTKKTTKDVEKETSTKKTTTKKTTEKATASTETKAAKTVAKEASAQEKPTTRTYYKSYGKSFGGKRRKKFCKFCAKGIEHVDYKDVDTLKKYLNQHLKIMAARVTGTCGRHQRRVSNAIKRARIVALIPFVIQD